MLTPFSGHSTNLLNAICVAIQNGFLFLKSSARVTALHSQYIYKAAISNAPHSTLLRTLDICLQ